MEDNKDEKIRQLEAELAEYRRMAESYGITPEVMLSLAKSQIKTTADSIRVREVLGSIYRFLHPFLNVDRKELLDAKITYDGDGSKAYCDLVWNGLDLIWCCEGMCKRIEEVL